METDENRHKTYCMWDLEWLLIGASPIFTHLTGCDYLEDQVAPPTTPMDIAPIVGPSKWSDYPMDDTPGLQDITGSAHPAADEDMMEKGVEGVQDMVV